MRREELVPAGVLELVAGRLRDDQLCCIVLTLVTNNGPDRVAEALYAAIVYHARLEREHAINSSEPEKVREQARVHAYLGHLVGEAVRKAVTP